MTTPIIVGSGLTRVFGKAGEEQTHALRGIDVAFEPATITAIMGPSGSGKSTLLYCLAGLDQPTMGRTTLLDRDIATLSRADIARFRRDHVGFIFQQYNLIPSISVFENVALPQRLAGRSVDGAAIDAVLESVGMLEKRDRLPAQLSGGQQQRVAIARVMATRPEIVFADEPTGALDTGTGERVLELLQTAASSQGQCVVMATHDPAVAARCDRVLFVQDGLIVQESHGATAEQIADVLVSLRKH